MDFTTGQRRLLFVVVVIVLVGLGIFVIHGRNQGSAAAPTATPTPTRSTSAASVAATASSPAASPNTSSSATTPAATSPGANIYQWLPFTQADLNEAAKTTLAFANVYANTSYTETKADYNSKLAGLTTTQEAATLVSDFESPEIANTRTADKQVATGTPTIDSINSFGPEAPEPAGPPSITFAVTIAQKLVSTSGTMTSSPEYTITTVSTATGWQVENIQLASLGNQ